MTPSHPPAPLPRSLILLLALASGQAVAGTFYAQPLLDAIAASFGIPEGSAGAVIAVTQVGYAVGLVLWSRSATSSNGGI
jgi:predicted MFS family arabinose efflux permease